MQPEILPLAAFSLLAAIACRHLPLRHSFRLAALTSLLVLILALNIYKGYSFYGEQASEQIRALEKQLLSLERGTWVHISHFEGEEQIISQLARRQQMTWLGEQDIALDLSQVLLLWCKAAQECCRWTRLLEEEMWRVVIWGDKSTVMRCGILWAEQAEWDSQERRLAFK